MYGFGGVGQVEVRFGQMSPWRDERTNEQPTEQTRKDRANSANGLWKAEMSKNIKLLKKFKPRPHCSELKRIKIKRGKNNKIFSRTIPQSKAEKYRNYGI